MGRRLGDGGPGHRRCGLRARSRPRRAPGRRRRRRALLEVGRAQPLGMRLRVRLPRPARHGDPRALGQFGPPGDGAHPRRGASGGRRSGHRDPRLGHSRGHRLRPSLGHTLRAGTGQERLRRAHLHPADPAVAPARDPPQAQPDARGSRRQAARRRRRFDRPGEHAARTDRYAARGGGGRSPRPHLLAACDVAVFLRHRLPDPGRARRQRHGRRGDPPCHRSRLPRLHFLGRDGARHRPAPFDPVHRLLHG